MEQATRRQLLADMGIAVWRLRADQSAARQGPVAGPAAAEAARAEPVAPIAGPAAVAEATGAVTAAAATSRVPPAPPDQTTESPVQPATRPASPPAVEPAVEPWSALSLVQGTALILVPADASQRDLRLAQDLLAAAGGDSAGKAEARRFDWPSGAGAGIAADAAAGRRAFAAFVGKDVADHGTRVLLCVASLVDALPRDVGCRLLCIADLAEFGLDAAAKRDLWRRLAEPAG